MEAKLNEMLKEIKINDELYRKFPRESFFAFSKKNNECYIIYPYKVNYTILQYNLFTIPFNNSESQPILQSFHENSEITLNSIILEHTTENRLCIHSDKYLFLINNIQYVSHLNQQEKKYTIKSIAISTEENNLKFNIVKFSNFPGYIGVIMSDFSFRFYNAESMELIVSLYNREKIIDFEFSLIEAKGIGKFSVYFLEQNGDIYSYGPLLPTQFNLPIILFHKMKSYFYIQYNTLDLSNKEIQEERRTLEFFALVVNEIEKCQCGESKDEYTFIINDKLRNLNENIKKKKLLIQSNSTYFNIKTLNKLNTEAYKQLKLINVNPIVFLCLKEFCEIEVIVINGEIMPLLPGVMNFKKSILDYHRGYIVECINLNIENYFQNKNSPLQIISYNNKEKEYILGYGSNIFLLSIPYVNELNMIVQNDNSNNVYINNLQSNLFQITKSEKSPFIISYQILNQDTLLLMSNSNNCISSIEIALNDFKEKFFKKSNKKSLRNYIKQFGPYVNSLGEIEAIKREVNQNQFGKCDFVKGTNIKLQKESIGDSDENDFQQAIFQQTQNLFNYLFETSSSNFSIFLEKCRIMENTLNNIDTVSLKRRVDKLKETFQIIKEKKERIKKNNEEINRKIKEITKDLSGEKKLIGNLRKEKEKIDREENNYKILEDKYNQLQLYKLNFDDYYPYDFNKYSSDINEEYSEKLKCFEHQVSRFTLDIKNVSENI